MTHDHFWQIIQSACRSESRASEQWHRRLVDALIQLPADEIIAWNHIFDRFVAAAYTVDLMAAYYFRCWLVGMGQDVYTAALADADSLASVALPLSTGVDAEAEIYAAAHQAWMQVTGEPDTADYPARNEAAEPTGEDWDFDDPDLRRQHLPRLVAFYGDG